MSIPAHILAVLQGKIHAIAVNPIAPVRDKTPVFAPQQSGKPHAVRSLSSVIEEQGEIESHTLDTDIQCNGVQEDWFSLGVNE